jgi:hypothetical protein
VRVDGVGVKALQQRGAGVLQGTRETHGFGEQGRAKLKETSTAATRTLPQRMLN